MHETDLILICQSIWPCIPPGTFNRRTYIGFWDFLQLQTCSIPRQSNLDHINVAQFASLIEQISRDASYTQSIENATRKVKTHLGESLPETARLEYLDQAFRVMLTMRIRSMPAHPEVRSHIQLKNEIAWESGSTLTKTIETFFINRKTSAHSERTSRIPPSMSMAYLCKHRGFKVFWTVNLADHLTIDWRFKTITVYEHKIFLWNHLRNSSNPIIPQWILEEAIDTLNVLFPLDDDMTETLLKGYPKISQGVGYCGRPRNKCFDLAKFNVWRASMADLVDVMNQEPRGIRQLALERDGRNLLPFLTFWVAIAVAALGILNIPFAIVSMKYTIKQYELALAQACSESQARDSLPQYCN